MLRQALADQLNYLPVDLYQAVFHATPKQNVVHDHISTSSTPLNEEQLLEFKIMIAQELERKFLATFGFLITLVKELEPQDFSRQAIISHRDLNTVMQIPRDEFYARLARTDTGKQFTSEHPDFATKIYQTFFPAIEQVIKATEEALTPLAHEILLSNEPEFPQDLTSERIQLCRD